MSRDSVKPRMMVRIECIREWRSTEGIEFLNIEEDFYGRDSVTFKCPECGETHTALPVPE